MDRCGFNNGSIKSLFVFPFMFNEWKILDDDTQFKNKVIDRATIYVITLKLNEVVSSYVRIPGRHRPHDTGSTQLWLRYALTIRSRGEAATATHSNKMASSCTCPSHRRGTWTGRSGGPDTEEA